MKKIIALNIVVYLVNKVEEIATFVLAFWLVKQLGII